MVISHEWRLIYKQLALFYSGCMIRPPQNQQNENDNSQFWQREKNEKEKDLFILRKLRKEIFRHFGFIIDQLLSKRCLHKFLYVYMSLCMSRHQMSGFKVSFTKIIDAWNILMFWGTIFPLLFCIFKNFWRLRKRFCLLWCLDDSHRNKYKREWDMRLYYYIHYIFL